MITVIIPLGEKRSLEALNSLEQQHKAVKWIVERGANPSENRNRGVKKARTSLVAFINSHTTLPENWSEEIKHFFEEHPTVDIVGGPQLSSPQESFFGEVSGYALSSLFGASEVRTRYTVRKDVALNVDERSLTSSNLICKKKVFKKVRFDESIYPGEDPKFIRDAKKAGFLVAYSPDIVAFNRRRGTFSELKKQIYYYGYTRPQKESLWETLHKPSFLVPEIFVFYLFFLPTLLIFDLIFIWPLLLYCFLDFVFSIYLTIKSKKPFAFFLLLSMFPVIHISYGLGFIAGSFSKNIRHWIN
jgi:hypothetical protein